MALREIIVGCDDGAGARDALRFAGLLARVARANIVLANVYRRDRERALRLVTELERTLPYGTRAELRVIEGRSVVQGLRALVSATAAQLIVVGAGRRSSLITGSPCAVAVSPRGFADDLDPGLRVIGVAYDGSAESREALAAAADLALAAHAALKLIGVVEAPPPPTTNALYPPQGDFDYRGALQAELESVADELPLSLRTQVVLVAGEAAPVLIKQAEPLSLLVMGSHGRGPLGRALLGSVSQPVLRAAPCPVLAVPRGVEAQRAAA